MILMLGFVFFFFMFVHTSMSYMHEESQIGKVMSTISISMNQINQNSNWHFKCLLLTRNKQLVFYLITIMVLRASSYGPTLNA
jgi:membrane protein CcdC involved in cytochrome C biogenesis